MRERIIVRNESRKHHFIYTSVRKNWQQILVEVKYSNDGQNRNQFEFSFRSVQTYSEENKNIKEKNIIKKNWKKKKEFKYILKSKKEKNNFQRKKIKQKQLLLTIQESNKNKCQSV